MSKEKDDNFDSKLDKIKSILAKELGIPEEEIVSTKEGELHHHPGGQPHEYYHPEKKNQVVKRIIPAKPEWVKRFTELHEIAKELSAGHKKVDSGRALLWGMIHEELDNYEEDMHYNTEKQVIEVMENIPEKKEEPKPIDPADLLVHKPKEPGTA